ncbi:MAG: alpha-N-arabinofuranosidase [Phycicoccus sp.]|nr:alpha-N-arabinofuranosidase [Cellulomonas sp.]NMM24404.1 alpha-N-arabinofuranosidase [Phycicoccus sp.]
MSDAHLVLDPRLIVAPINRRLFGSFVEHLGRSVYNGIYEPTHPSADADGFRQDVIELVKELGVTTIRYPGGNFVSGFRWEDSVGPREARPVRLDLAWHSTETNEVGLHEFAGWLDKVGGELMMAVNLGTRGPLAALDLLEYCNVHSGSTLSEQRRTNGRSEPFGITMWCLGNEMDGPWQLGHRSADDYGKLAAMTAAAMRQLDPGLELVACGSSSASMPTFGDWERTVLTHTYDTVDYISCHAYYEERDGDLGSFLASAVNMDKFIETVVATADFVKAVKKSSKTMYISFDEWNVWYLSRFENVDKITDIATWPRAPRLSEDVYSLADAVVFGNLMISLLKHADRVTSASMAQLVNVIAPIMTEPGGPAWKQTTFYPFALVSRLARGVTLLPVLSGPTYETRDFGEVPEVDAVSTWDKESRASATFFVNRSQTESCTVTLDHAAVGQATSVTVQTLTDSDFYAANTREEPHRVHMNALEYSMEGDTIRVIVPPVSWTAVSVNF